MKKLYVLGACVFGCLVGGLYLAQTVISEYAQANSFAAAKIRSIDGQ